MSGLLHNRNEYGVIGILFTVAFFCWFSSSSTHAMSIPETGRDRYNKKTLGGHGVEVREIPQYGEDYGSTKHQQLDSDEEEDDSAVVYVGSDESSSAEKTRLSAGKRRLRFNKRRLQASKRRLRLHKKGGDSTDDSSEENFDRKEREPRLRFHDVRKRSTAADEQSENTETEESQLGNSRSRRSVNSAVSSINKIERFKRLSVNNNLRVLSDLAQYNAAVRKEQLAQEFQKLLRDLGKRSEPVIDSDPVHIGEPGSLF